MSDLEKQLAQIIATKQLVSLFQPIISLASQNIFSFEALIRGPSNSILHNPLSLFSYANKFNRVMDLEHTCRKVSIRQYVNLNFSQKLFLNISPKVLLHPDFKQGETLRFLKQSGLSPESVVIEITEQQPIDDFDLMRDAVNHYRGMGFEIALDDLGTGYSGLRLWTELMPDYVKIDRHFIQGIDKDRVKLNFVRSIQDMASASNCQIIAEGIETEAEFLAVESLGIPFVQGYYFARPVCNPTTELDKNLFNVLQKNQDQLINPSKSIVSIIKQITPVKPETKVLEVLKIFQKSTQIEFIPIVNNDICTGLIYKDKFLTKLFASQYGIELYGKKPIALFLQNVPQTFDKNIAIESVSQKLTDHLKTDSAFIITDKNCYLGVGTIIDLLEEITCQQIKNAQHANPLTLLPGITPINEQMNYLLKSEQPFAIGYFDLDYFKPFNDHYGYNAGDKMIKLVTSVLQKTLVSKIDYIGHIGGDDFIVIFRNPNWLQDCKIILQTFETEVLNLYSAEDRQHKGINGHDRQGNSCFFPLSSLSIGIIEEHATASCSSHIEVSDLAAEAKHQAKLITGNSYFINKRLAKYITCAA